MAMSGLLILGRYEIIRPLGKGGMGKVYLARELCLVMEYVRGVSVRQLIEQRGPMPPARVGRLLGQLCSVLQAAHQSGILHRDLTADNLMVVDAGTDKESLKVMDFGLARSDAGG